MECIAVQLRLTVKFFEERQAVLVNRDIVIQQLAVKLDLWRFLKDRVHHARDKLAEFELLRLDLRIFDRVTLRGLFPFPLL